jgi:hypothetical protein
MVSVPLDSNVRAGEIEQEGLSMLRENLYDILEFFLIVIFWYVSTAHRPTDNFGYT